MLIWDRIRDVDCSFGTIPNAQQEQTTTYSAAIPRIKNSTKILKPITVKNMFKMKPIKLHYMSEFEKHVKI